MSGNKSGGIRKIASGIVSLVVIVALFRACTGGFDKAASDITNGAYGSGESKSGSVQSAENGQDGAADGYSMTSFQVPVEQVINDYHEKGYTYVWLTSHELKNDNGNIGEMGTVDNVYLRATYIDPNKYYHVTEEIGTVYGYWGSEIGWKSNYDAATLANSDMTGFNGTYWKLGISEDGDGSYLYETATALIGEEIMSQYNAGSSTVGIYFAFENFEAFKARIEDAQHFDKIRIYIDSPEKNEIGIASVVVDGDIYSVPLRLRGASGGGYNSNLHIGKGASFCFECVERYGDCNVKYGLNTDFGLVPISAEEYEATLRGRVQTVHTAGIEESSKESGSNTQENFGMYDLEKYLDTLYPAEGGDDIVSLYTDSSGNLCVWYGNSATEEEYYSKTYEEYVIYEYSLYGNAGGKTDEFVFMDDGHVDVLLDGYGSTHYQSYIREEAYFR